MMRFLAKYMKRAGSVGMILIFILIAIPLGSAVSLYTGASYETAITTSFAVVMVLAILVLLDDHRDRQRSCVQRERAIAIVESMGSRVHPESALGKSEAYAEYNRKAEVIMIQMQSRRLSTEEVDELEQAAKAVQ